MERGWQWQQCEFLAGDLAPAVCALDGEGGTSETKEFVSAQIASLLLLLTSRKTRPGFFFFTVKPWVRLEGEKKFIMQRGMIYSFKICQAEFGAASSLCQMRKREALTFRDAPRVIYGITSRVCWLWATKHLWVKRCIHVSAMNVFSPEELVSWMATSAHNSPKKEISSTSLYNNLADIKHHDSASHECTTSPPVFKILGCLHSLHQVDTFDTLFKDFSKAHSLFYSKQHIPAIPPSCP